MCDRLVRKDLVRRRTERGDRRQLRVALTEKGRSLVDAVTDRRRREIGLLMKDIPSEEQVVLIQALGRLTTSAGEVPEQDWTTGWEL
jgi:DNA-binding MarR family transcriptional regulator